MRDVRYPIGSRFQEWTRRVSQLAEVPVSLPFAVDVLCSLPFPLFSFFCLRFCFLFCFRTKVHPHGKVERKERPILSALYYERYIERQPTLSTTGWEKRVDSGAEWPSWNVRVGRDFWVGAWAGLGFISQT